MSKVVDERVVSMQFDNSNFEKNIQGTLSTLDKFKQKLHLDGAAKGLETVDKAARSIDMTPLAKGLEVAHSKFSALEVMGVTALANLTNSAINAGKKFASALFVEPKSDGFKEYELLLNSIQTTMNATGLSAKEVEEELKKLDEYADKTVYSTSDMLTNLSKFTNAGVPLGVATKAMIGIANATAHSGGGAREASMAFYNLGQAIGTGYLSRLDYKSIENANIHTQTWKKAMIEAAIAQGTLTQVGENAYKAGKKTYSLQQLFIDGLQEQWATADVLLEVFGDYGDETTKIGKEAYEAATKVKTFTAMMESLKATAGTGWKDTWQLIFGDLDGATKMWTSLTNALSAVITAIANIRNSILESALGRGFTNLSKKIQGALDPVTKTADKISDVVDTVKDYTKVVNEIIGGDWGNGEKRWSDLAAAGYDWAHAQNLVNEKLGDSTRHTTKLTDAQKKLIKSEKKAAKTSDSLTDAEAKQLAGLVKLTDEQLKARGYTDDQIEALRELEKEANKTGYSVEEFVKKIDKINGRTLFIEAFENIGNSLMSIFGAIKDAWVEVFEITPEGVGQTLYDIIAGFHKLTSYLVINDETTDKLKRTFKGLFAILDIITTVVGGPIKIAFKVLTKILGLFDMDILDLTAKIGDAIVGFRDWVDSVTDFTEVFEKIEPALTKGLDAIKEWASGIKEKFGTIASNVIEGLTNGLGKGVSKVWNAIVNIGKTIIEGIKNILGIHSPSTVMEEIGDNTIQGYTNGLNEGVKSITDVIINIFRTLGAFFPKLAIFNQIAWIITTMKSAGGEITSNFGEGISNGISNVTDAIKKVFTSIKNAFGNFDWSKLSAGLWVVSAFIPKFAILNIGAAISGLMSVVGGNATEGLKEGISSGASGVLDSIGNLINKVVEFVKNLLGIHSPSTVFLTIGKFLIAGLILGIIGSKTGLFDAIKKTIGPVIDWVKEKFNAFKDWLSNVDFPEIKMENVLGIGILVGLALFAKKLIDIATSLSKGIEAFGNGVETFSKVAKKLTGGMDTLKKKGKWDSIADNALKLSAAIAVLAGSVYLLSKVEHDKLWDGVKAIAALAGIVLVLGIVIKSIKFEGSEFGKFSLMLVAISASLWVMASAIKKLSFLDENNIWFILGGTAAMIIGLSIILATLGKLVKGKTAANIDKAGITILKISAALAIMAFAVKLLGGLDQGILTQGVISVMTFAIVVKYLIESTQSAGKKIDSAGSTILKMAAAIAIMAIAVKLLGKMEIGHLIQGGIAVAAFAALIRYLIKSTQLVSDKDLTKVGGTILAVGAAIMMLAITAAICSMISWGGLGKAGVAIVVLSAIMVGLIAATKLATDKELKGVARTILVMSLAIAIMGATAMLFSMISWGGLGKAGAAIVVLGGILTAMIRATRGASDCHKNIMMMAIAIGVMAAAVAVLSFIEPTKLIAPTLAMGSLMYILKLMIEAAGKAQSGMGVLIVLGLVIGELGFILYKLSELPAERVLASAGGLSAALLAMALALKIISKIDTKNAFKAILALSALVVPLNLFGWSIAKLPDLSNKLNTIYILTGVMAAMSVLVYILNKMNIDLKKAIDAIIALTALVVPLNLFGWSIALLPDLSSKINTIVIMTGVMYAMTGLLAILNTMKVNLKDAISGVIGLTAMVIPLVAFAAAFALLPDMTPFIGTINILMSVMRELTGMLTILAIIGPLALIGVAALIALESLIVATGVFAVAVGALMEKFPALESFLNTGLGVLKNIARGLGEMISEFAAGLTSGLPEIGANLSSFMTNLSGFISGANMISDDMGDKIMTLSKAILLLTAADLIAGISSFIQGGSSFAQLGSDLSAFMMNAMPFMLGLSMVKPESLTAVKALAEAILILTATDLISGLTSWITGGSSLADFGAELALFGPYMALYAAAVAGIDGPAVEASANAAKALSEMAANLPNSGGVVGWFMGENDMAAFGVQLVAFGSALKLYGIAVTGLAVDAINTSVTAAKSLIEVAKEIPNTGGCLAFFAGDNSMATFGTQIVLFGTALKMYGLIVTGLAVDAINTSVEAAKSLIAVAQEIPNTGGCLAFFAGDNSMATFGTQIVLFGMALNAYGVAVTGLNIPAIMLSVMAAQQLAKLAQALPSDGGFWSLFKDDKINFTDFGKQIKKLGEGLQGYSNKVAKLNASAVSSSIASAKKLVSLIKSMGGLDSSGVAAFSEAIGKLGKASVDKFVKAFTSSTSKLNNIGGNLIKAVANGAKSATGNLTNVVNSASKAMNDAFANKQETFKSIGIRLLNALISGFNSKKESVYKAMQSVAGKGVSGARARYTNFYNAGSYCVSGFVQGIKDNKYKAADAGTSLGKAAYTAAKAAIQSNSPSKKFMELGMFADQGLAKGLLNYAYLATRASAGLGRGIVTSMQEELGIHSPAKVIKDEVGRYVIEGLAEGITDDMSAEEAAEQKAKNIVDAFNDELEKHDLDMTTSDLEYELWEVQNESASAAEKTAQKAASIYKRVASQTEKVALAQAEYRITFETFGETSEKTQEAYNKWVQEQIDLNNETKSLLEARNESIQATIDELDTSTGINDAEYNLWEARNPKATDGEKSYQNIQRLIRNYNDQAEKEGIAHAKYVEARDRLGEDNQETKEMYESWIESDVELTNQRTELTDSIATLLGTQKNNKNAYDAWMRKNYKTYADDGIDETTIRKVAQNETGFNLDIFNKANLIDVEGIMSNAAGLAMDAYTDTINTLTGPLVASGVATGTAFSEGVEKAAPGVEAAVQTVTAACTGVSSIKYTDWVEFGKTFVSKFAEGVTSAIDTATQATITMISSAYQAVVDFINDPENANGFVPTISPILDLSRIQNGVSQMNGMFATSTAALADINVRLTNDSLSELSEIADEMRRSNESNHSEIVNTIRTLREDVSNLAVAMNNMQIRMDTGALVGSLSGPMDKSLGQKVSYKGRGN